MDEKRKNADENIVRRDDSGNEIEPLNDGISKQFYNLLGIFLEKSGRAEKPNPTHDFELLKEHRLQTRNDFITERIERRKANGANIGEDYYRRLEALWIEKELAIVDKWIDENKNRSIPISEIDDVNDHLTEYKKYLEQLKNPGKPDAEKERLDQSPSYYPNMPEILKTAFQQLELLDSTGNFIGKKKQVKPLFDVLIAKAWFKNRASRTKKANDLANLMQTEFGFYITGKTIMTGERDKDQEYYFNEFNRFIRSYQSR